MIIPKVNYVCQQYSKNKEQEAEFARQLFGLLLEYIQVLHTWLAMYTIALQNL